MRRPEGVKIIVSAALLILFFTKTSIAAPRERAVDIKHISVVLFFDQVFNSGTINATAEVTLTPLKPLSVVKLDAAFFFISRIQFPDGKKLAYRYDSSDKNDNLVITLNRVYQPGENIRIVIGYRPQWRNETDPNAIGGSNGKGIRILKPSSGDQRRKWQAWSMAEYHSNRYWLPGYDDPDDLRTTNISAYIPDWMEFISNGRRIDTRPNTMYGDSGMYIPKVFFKTEMARQMYYKNGKMLDRYVPQNASGHHFVTFQSEKPYASHQAAFVLGQFTDVKQSFENIQIHNYSLSDEVAATKASVVRLPDMMKYFSKITGVKYHYTEYSQVFVQDLPYGMENISMATQTENMVDDEGTHADFLYLWDALEAESLARNWFGGHINIRNWSDCWLNRSFSLYFDRLYNEYKNGKDEVLLYPFFFDRATWLADWNAGVRHPIVTDQYTDEAAFVTGNTTYIRGELVLHMLRKELGDETWWKAIQLYLKMNAGKQVTTLDFQKAVETAAGKPMQWFFDQWVYGIGHPVFEISKRYDAGAKQLLLTIKQVQQPDTASTYLQTRFFQGNMQVEVDGVISTIRIKPEAEQVITFPADKEPLFVNTDVEQTWIGEIKQGKTTDELLYQFKNSKDITARRTAAAQLAALINQDSATTPQKKNILTVFQQVIGSKEYWRFRWIVLSQLQSVWMKQAGNNPVRPDKTTVDLLLSVIKNDSSWVKFAAINFLGNTKDSAYTSIYLNNLYDKSDRVVYAAAIALGKTKSSKAFEALRKLPARPSWKNQSLISSLAGLKELGDPRGYAIAFEAMKDVSSSRWTLVTPLWDYQIQAAQTIVALNKQEEAFPAVMARFNKSVYENNTSDIFTSLYLLTILGDQRAQEAFDQLKIKYKEDANALAAVQAQEETFHQNIKK